MGNQFQQRLEVMNPLGAEWREVQSESRISNKLPYVVLRSIQTGEEVQEYMVSLPTQCLLQQLNKYNLRHTQHNNLISIRSVEVVMAGGICSGSRDRLRVVTERVVSNLSGSSGLLFQQALMVLQKSLVGFQTIYRYVGFVPLGDRLIFFNQKGEVKVWMNENLSLNEPKDHIQVYHKGEEAKMVEEIFLAVEAHSVNPSQMTSIRKLLFSSNLGTFEKATTYVNALILEQRLQIPSRISNNVSVINPVTLQEPSSMVPRDIAKLTRTAEVMQYLSEDPVRVVYKAQESSLVQTLPQYPSSILSPPKSTISSVRQIQTPKQLFQSSQRSIVTSPSPVRRRSTRMSPNESTRMQSPIKSQPLVYFSKNMAASPEPTSSTRVIRTQVVSSPYFQQQSKLSLPDRKDETEMSKVSSVSIYSNHSKSHNQAQPSEVGAKKVSFDLKPSPSAVDFELSKLTSNSSEQTTQKPQPSINDIIIQNAKLPPSTRVEQSPNRESVGLQQSIKITNKKQNKTKAVEWIKIVRKQPILEEAANKQSPLSSKNNSKIPTQVPNSPLDNNDALHYQILNSHRLLSSLLQQSPVYSSKFQLDPKIAEVLPERPRWESTNWQIGSILDGLDKETRTVTVSVESVYTTPDARPESVDREREKPQSRHRDILSHEHWSDFFDRV